MSFAPVLLRTLLSFVLALWFVGPLASAGTAPRGAPHQAALAPQGRVTIDAVGDVMLGGAVADIVDAGGPDAPFSSIMPVLRKADAVVGNLECALSTGGTPTAAKSRRAIRSHKEWLLRGSPTAAKGLRDAGFAAVSVANNHTMDYGPSALRDTLVTLASNGVGSAGAGSDSDEAWRPAYFARGGTRFALIAVSDVLPRGFSAGANHAGVAPGRSLVTGDVDAPSIARLRAVIQRARSGADVVIVYEHWGEEMVKTPTAEQRSAAHAAIDAGATIVLGSHPHVLGPIEAYRGGLIAYSLGNFVFDAYPGPTAATEVLELTFDGARLAGWDTVPATIVGGVPMPVRRTAVR